ncbi:MAG: hypothetical protein KJN62_08865 [Deltaproteobacteria bacterium]|nr:hypothetical protein [Deltaproteobacteria bacterium]
MKKNDCHEYVKLIQRRGGRWSAKGIGREILRIYGLQFSVEGIKANLIFLISSGCALSAPVESKGEVIFEYWWIKKQRKKKPSVIPITVGELMQKCLAAAGTYPFHHLQREKIMVQYAGLEKIDDRERTYVNTFR